MIIVRHAEPNDHELIHHLFAYPEIIYWTIEMPFTPLEQTHKRFTNRSEGYYTLVACNPDEVIGVLEFTVFAAPRLRHVARLGPIAVHPQHQGKGAGSKLMKAAINLADNWLNLHRLELIVYTDNDSAIALYHKFGFTSEGVLKNLAVRSGQYADVHLMARLKQ
ncbi:MAG: GNAT family N-acetyltransferase [Cyanobacteria bacterium CRU_2_1]|nr:GNAT family N-acetyltransferase [Cyanobacteria bacterium CRU_2_1]